MANEIVYMWESGQSSILADVFQPDGSVREINIALSENPTGGMYLGSCATIADGDYVRIKQSGIYLAGYKFLGNPAVVGSQMTLANDAITSAKYDESTAFPVSEKQSKAASTIVLGAVVADAGNSTTQFKTDLTEATNDHYNGRIVIFRTGVLAGQATDITDYDGTNKIVTVTAMTETPTATDEFVIV